MRHFADDWGWTRPKEDIFAPAKNFEGGVRNDLDRSNTGPKRKDQPIWRQDRKQSLNMQPEPYGYPGWESLTRPEKITSTWDPQDYIDEVRNLPAGRDIGDNTYFDTYNLYQADRPMAAGRKINMKKVAEEEKEKEQLKEVRKELGITLNANGMPTVSFRDGSFVEVRKKVVDARSRHQGIDEEAEYVVINTYPSLGYENEVGRGGYRTIEAAEKMLINYAKPHLARGLTFTY